MRSTVAILLVLLVAAALVRPGTSTAQTEGTVPEKKVTSVLRLPGEELDRVEVGAAIVQGFFDVVGSVGYRRLVRPGSAWDQSLIGELAGTSKNQLTEAVVDGQYLFRPTRTYDKASRIRPLLEGGPALYLSMQGASIDGFNKTAYHARVYLKSHVYAGVEALLTRKLGLVVRGRMTAPSHHPFDYAQAAILFR